MHFSEFIFCMIFFFYTLGISEQLSPSSPCLFLAFSPPVSQMYFIQQSPKPPFLLSLWRTFASTKYSPLWGKEYKHGKPCYFSKNNSVMLVSCAWCREFDNMCMHVFVDVWLVLHMACRCKPLHMHVDLSLCVFSVWDWCTYPDMSAETYWGSGNFSLAFM